MKKILWALCLIITSVLWAQQTPNVHWGSKQSMPNLFSVSQFILEDQGNVYTIQDKQTEFLGTTSSTYILERFDAEQKLSHSEKVELKQGKKEKKFEFVLPMNQEIYLFTSFKNQKLKKNFLFCQTINKESLKPNNDTKKIAEVDYSKHSKNNSGEFGYELSADSTRLLVYYKLKVKKKEKPVGLYMLNNKLEEQWHKELKITDIKSLLSIKEFRIDAEGNVHMLIRELSKNFTYNQLGIAYHDYRLLSYYHKDDQLKEFYFPETERLYNKITIQTDKNLDVLCSGFYSGPDSLMLRGSFFLKLDGKTSTISAQDHQPFELEMLTKYMGPTAEKSFTNNFNKGLYATTHYQVDSLISKKNGGYILLGEFVHSFQEEGIKKHITSNILITHIEPDGKISKTHQVPKVQSGSYSLSNSYLSFIAHYDEEQLHIIYNDRIENMPYKEKANPKSYKKGSKKKAVCMMASIDKAGNLSQTPLFYNADQPYQMKPKLSKLLAGNRLLLYGQKGKNRSMGLLSLPLQ